MACYAAPSFRTYGWLETPRTVQPLRIGLHLFNLHCFLFQVAEQRAQTQGTWRYLNKRGFERTKLPNPTTLTPSQRRELLALFEELRGVAFPSLLEQLRTSFEGRRKLDAAWLSVLGVAENDQGPVLEVMHRYLYETLETLRRTMAKD